VRSTARAIRGSNAPSPSRYCPNRWLPIRSSGNVSIAKRARSHSWIILTSARFTQGKLKKVSIVGGTWGTDGTIVFAGTDVGLNRVAEKAVTRDR
jgi:hypothetical protein